MNFYDMHSHILPELDDGARSVQESVLMLEALKKQGVTNVCFTPHMYSHELSADDFLASRQESFEMLLPHLPDGMQFCLGAEVYVTDYLFVNENLNRLCYGTGRYMLTEFPYSSNFTDNSYKSLLRLVEEHEITPIIPHIERYPALMKSRELRDALKELGVLFQTNTCSFDKLFRKIKLTNMVKDGEINLFGTDAHSFERNSPQSYSQTIKLLEGRGCKENLQEISNTAKSIFIPIK